MGITKTVLLPAGSKYGLAANCGGNDTVVAIARANPKKYVFFANELPDIPETRRCIEKYLKLGAIGIGEQKVPCGLRFQIHAGNRGNRARSQGSRADALPA